MIRTVVRTRNMFKKFGEFDFALSNIEVNGVVTGCSGFITHPVTGKTIYVTTEDSAYGPLSIKTMYRNARSTSDYSGLRNRWGITKNNEWVRDAVRLLNDTTDND